LRVGRGRVPQLHRRRSVRRGLCSFRGPGTRSHLRTGRTACNWAPSDHNSGVHTPPGSQARTPIPPCDSSGGQGRRPPHGLYFVTMQHRRDEREVRERRAHAKGRIRPPDFRFWGIAPDAFGRTGAKPANPSFIGRARLVPAPKLAALRCHRAPQMGAEQPHGVGSETTICEEAGRGSAASEAVPERVPLRAALGRARLLEHILAPKIQTMRS